MYDVAFRRVRSGWQQGALGELYISIGVHEERFTIGQTTFGWTVCDRAYGLLERVTLFETARAWVNARAQADPTRPLPTPETWAAAPLVTR